MHPRTPRARLLPLLVLSLTTACSGKDDSGDETVDSLEPKITGTVTAEGEASAQVAFYKAFAFDQGGKLLAYLSSSPNATCENVADYLRVSEGPYDPKDMFEGGHCNMFIIIDGDFDGSFSHTRPADSTEPNLVAAGTSMECAMGEGQFELTRLTESDRDDYYWSGRWWQGRPNAYTYDFSGGAGSSYQLTLEMSAYDGGFIHEELDDTPAVGAVSGTIEAEWCDALGSTGLF